MNFNLHKINDLCRCFLEHGSYENVSKQYDVSIKILRKEIIMISNLFMLPVNHFPCRETIRSSFMQLKNTSTKLTLSQALDGQLRSTI